MTGNSSGVPPNNTPSEKKGKKMIYPEFKQKGTFYPTKRTEIKINPSSKGEGTGRFLEQGQEYEYSQVVYNDNSYYLKLASGNGHEVFVPLVDMTGLILGTNQKGEKPHNVYLTQLKNKMNDNPDNNNYDSDTSTSDESDNVKNELKSFAKTMKTEKKADKKGLMSEIVDYFKNHFEIIGDCGVYNSSKKNIRKAAPGIRFNYSKEDSSSGNIDVSFNMKYYVGLALSWKLFTKNFNLTLSKKSGYISLNVDEKSASLLTGVSASVEKSIKGKADDEVGVYAEGGIKYNFQSKDEEEDNKEQEKPKDK